LSKFLPIPRKFFGEVSGEEKSVGRRPRRAVALNADRTGRLPAENPAVRPFSNAPVYTAAAGNTR